MDKIRVRNVWVRRAEGPTKDLGQHTVDSLEAADAHLKRWARTAPKDGSIDKVDFRISWEDGQTYDGRYELRYDDARKAGLIGPHVQDELIFHAGLRRPSHLSREDYEAYLVRSEMEGGPAQADYLDFLRKYEL